MASRPSPVLQGVAPHVRKYFEEHPEEIILPGPLTRWVGEARGMESGDTQSAGAVRAAINKGVEEGWVERIPGTPLKYKFKPDGKAPTSTPPPPLKTATPPPPSRKRHSFHMRPTGEKYFPRAIGDFTDVQFMRKARVAKLYVMLYGPPGGGKTALVEAAYWDKEMADKGEVSLITMSGDADTTVPDFTGDFVRIPENKDDDDAWADGPLVLAMTANGGKGCPLFVDDATLISPGVMSVVYPAIDGRGKINVKSRPPKMGREVVAGPDFYVVSAHNPGVPGAILSEALSSRFTVQIEVTTDYDLIRSMGVNAKAITVAKNLEKNRKNGQMAWSPQARELIAFKKSEEEFDTAIACRGLIAQAPDGEDRERVKMAIATTFAIKMEHLQLDGQV